MRICLFFLIFLSFLPLTKGQKYKLYSTEDGLSKSNVTQIIKDSRGFMWFGTLVGLNRFDGYKFINYYHDISDSTSISNNNIRKIVEAKNGDLWIATTYGLNKYVFDYDIFLRYYQSDKANSISDNFINSIYLDDRGILWIATIKGIDRFDPGTGEFKHFSYRIGGDPEGDAVPIFDITRDDRGLFWLCTSKDGLVSFIEETEQFYSYNGEKGDVPSGNLINEKFFIASNDDELKIQASNGIFRFDLKRKEFSRDFSSLPNIEISSTVSYGINNYYVDNAHMRWYSISNKGVFSYDSHREKFKSWSVETSSGGLIGEKVSAMVEDKNGKIWLGTNQGICSYDPIKQEFTNRNNSKAEIYKITAGIVSLCIDANDNLWAGSGLGLYKYNMNDKSLQTYYSTSHDTTTLLNNNIMCIFEDSKGKIWVGAGGLNLFQPETNDFKQFKPDPRSNKTVNTSYIVNIFEDETGKLWIGTWAGGINIYDPEEGTFTYMMIDQENAGLLKTNDIANIYMDSKGFLWFSSTGATRYNRLTKDYDWFSIKDGIPNNAVANILEDNNGMIWISTENGMAMLDIQTRIVRSFSKLDGLQGNEFTYNAALKSGDGKLYFGGNKGFSIVDPDNIPLNEHKPTVVFTDFQIFNQPVKIGDERNGHVILEKSITTTKEITLRHYESVFSLEFAALHYTIPQNNKYAYKMVGLDSDWNYTGADRRYATYTTLKPGKYTFKVKASNSDGFWDEEGASIDITILPPWWQTAWFRLILVIILFALILLFYYIQLHSIKSRNRKLDHQVRLKTRDLEEVNEQLNVQKNHLLELNESLKKYQEEILAQKDEIDKQNMTLKARNTEILEISQRLHDQDQIKLRYFTNISHEFRTPLTLIISPLDKLIHSETIKKEHLQQLTLIETNAKRLLGMVNQLLDIRKIESGTLPLKKEPGNFVEFCKTISTDRINF